MNKSIRDYSKNYRNIFKSKTIIENFLNKIIVIKKNYTFLLIIKVFFTEDYRKFQNITEF